MATRKATTVYLYELAWILPSFAIPVGRLVELAPGQYEVRMTAQIWAFAPNEIRVPAGSTVHFWATSKDVVHGLLIPKVHVNVMLLPGQVAHAVARFDTPGEYP